MPFTVSKGLALFTRICLGFIRKNTYICDVINPAYAGVLTHKGISEPTEMPFAVLKGADGG